jgi:hypothetical protein
MNLQEYNNVVGAVSQEFAETGLSIHQLFQWSIKKMHEMYELPINVHPSLDNLSESPLQRMQGFMKTLQKEMDEGKEILALLQFRESGAHDRDLNAEYESLVYSNLLDTGVAVDRAKKIVQELSASIIEQKEELTVGEAFDRFVLVAIADWLNDMTVYNRSEALKYGIPSESVLACIMGSNFTKLGEDGMPIKDENGKFLKGPNFVPPERAIYATMFEQDALVHEAHAIIEAADAVSTVALPILQDPMAEILFGSEEDDDDYGDMKNDDEFLLPPDRESAEEEWK